MHGTTWHFAGVDRAAAAGRVERAEACLGHLDGLTAPAFTHDAMRRGKEHEAHAFFLGGIDFLGDRRHVLAFAAIDDGGDRTLADHRAGAIDGGVAPADNDDALAKFAPLIACLALEEMQRADTRRTDRCPATRTWDSCQVPSDRNTASKVSPPGRARRYRHRCCEFSTNCTPRRRMISISRSSTSRGSRYARQTRNAACRRVRRAIRCTTTVVSQQGEIERRGQARRAGAHNRDASCLLRHGVWRRLSRPSHRTCRSAGSSRR